MFIKEICGPWIMHPFWRKSFVILDPKDIEALRASSIDEVWIDTEKGRDISSEGASLGEAILEIEVKNRIADDEEKALVSAPIGIEFERAAEIYSRSKIAVASMFSEARMGESINTEGAEKVVDEISDSIARNPHALISLARIKTADNYTYMHSIAVSALMIALAKQLGMNMDETQRLGIAGLLHDLGKAMTPRDILNKPGKLTAKEFATLQRHPEDGHRLLLDNCLDDDIVLGVALHHHEKIEGSGYPKGLRGKDISVFTRMGAICDVYDAITSNRPYKTGWDPAESLHKMAKWSKGHLDQKLLEAFVKSLGIYPVGSLVRLKLGGIAVVIDQVEDTLLAPRVKVFYSTKSRQRIGPEVIDLSSASCPDEIVSREDPARWNFPNLNELWVDQTA
ncbi:MAG: HD-GYP domain-containing protein [Candidatus Accumulibacter sp.]|jgi:putative nucleotidyltransferase with HDIG domain|nr:HD-GYP domain-containing protein [Accumulibacter sp.]